MRRHQFENEITMYDETELDAIDKSKLVYTEPKNTESLIKLITIFNAVQNYFIGAVGAVTAVFTKKQEVISKKQTTKEKGDINKAYSYAKKPYTNPKSVSYYYSYLPFHTYIGGAVFTISLTWFAWCLNYLLLFSANNGTAISDSVLTSFGLNELETIILIQPVSILLVIAVTYYFRKVTNRLFGPSNNNNNNKVHIPSLYYFSDPYVQSDSTEFSTHLAFDIFVNIPSQISHTINQNSIKEKNLGYAALQTVLDFIDTGDDTYIPTTKEEKIECLYNSMNPLYTNADNTFEMGFKLFKRSNRKPQSEKT
jgi:hypothetical protein